jgi:3-mercaptopyruvate sulfurtransferase SseA
VALRLKGHGITRVRPLQGGLGLWMDSQLPVEKLRDLTSAREPAA